MLLQKLEMLHALGGTLSTGWPGGAFFFLRWTALRNRPVRLSLPSPLCRAAPYLCWHRSCHCLHVRYSDGWRKRSRCCALKEPVVNTVVTVDHCNIRQCELCNRAVAPTFSLRWRGTESGKWIHVVSAEVVSKTHQKHGSVFRAWLLPSRCLVSVQSLAFIHFDGPFTADGNIFLIFLLCCWRQSKLFSETSQNFDCFLSKCKALIKMNI